MLEIGKKQNSQELAESDELKRKHQLLFLIRALL
jgi:hypothetical protein